jgi:hypothetical protein
MPHRLRHLTRFGLRSVIVALSLSCVLLAYHAHGLHRDRTAASAILRLGGTYRVRNPVVLICEEDGTVHDDRSQGQKLLGMLRPVFSMEIIEIYLGGKPPRRLPDPRGISTSWKLALDPTNKLPVHFPDLEAKIPATDADVSELRGLPILEFLDLSYTQVTDAVVDDLCSLPRLRLVRLEGTRMTSQGLAELRRRRPDCLISLTDWPPPPPP